MTLLTTVFASIISTIIWYMGAYKSKMRVGSLCLMYWGASLMWLVDSIFEYSELGESAFHPTPLDMLNDFYLGLSVVALGLIIWLAIILIKDPKGVIRNTLHNK